MIKKIHQENFLYECLLYLDDRLTEQVLLNEMHNSMGNIHTKNQPSIYDNNSLFRSQNRGGGLGTKSKIRDSTQIPFKAYKQQND